MEKRALIIEDNATNLDVLRALLQNERVNSASIQDPRQLNGFIEKNTPPDVIFLDLEMPYIDGYDVLDLLKSNPGWADVPVVACTVHTSELPRVREKAFHSFLAKPLDSDRFPEQLRQILEGRAVWDLNSQK